ncbi:MAG: hypothetical protein R3199_10770 [Gemmatimonadota bacterium]|nr:hypothetical protein [Gemmatimonadota bacterium]
MRTVLRLVLLFVLLGSVTASGCWKKERDHWSPTEALLRPPDMIAPQITNKQPPASVDVFHDERGLMFTAEDPPVDGFPGSGVDAAGVTATMNGFSFDVTRDGSMFSVDVSPLGSLLSGGQGPTAIDVTVPDLAGNVASTTFDFFYDPIAPAIQVDEFFPSGPVETGESSFTFRLSGSFDDPNFGGGEFKVAKPGSDEECGTDDDELWPQGTEGGQVSQNSFQLQATYDLSFDAFNGNTGDSPVTATYCGRLRGFDTARDKTGAANPNFAEQVFSTSLTWLPPQQTPAEHPTGQQAVGIYFGDLSRIGTQGSCPPSLVNQENARVTHDEDTGQMRIENLDPDVDVQGPYEGPSTGRFEGSGSTLLGNGFTIETSVLGTFFFDSNGDPFMDDEMVRDHFDPGGSRVCREIYEVLMTFRGRQGPY